MTSTWPPTPSVEDEEAALAHEYELESIASPITSDEDPPVKGTVDQKPIMIEVHPQTTHNDSSAIESDREHSSSDESHGPLTPSAANSEQRFVLLTHDTSNRTLSEAEWQLPRPCVPRVSRNASPETDRQGRRSDDYQRPYVTPIRTNVGRDFDEKATRHRGHPLPYSSGHAHATSDSKSRNRFSGDSFLSPQHASSDEYSRARSPGRRGKQEEARSMTDPEKSSERRRQHSRRRRETGIRSERPSLESLTTSGLDARSLSYSAAPVASMLASGVYVQAREDSSHADAVKQKRASRDIQYVSSAEEKARRYRSKSRRRRSKSRPRMDRTSTRESPHASSAEESRHRSHSTYRIPTREGKLSRRSSIIKVERPRLNIIDQDFSYGVEDPLTDKLTSSKHPSAQHRNPVSNGRSYLEPSSAHSTKAKAMEEYFAKALNRESNRSSYTPLASPNTSPCTSPPHTPPRTPRRARGSQEYYDPASNIVHQISRSRQTSGDYSAWNTAQPLKNATPAISATTASRMTPPLSRSSTVPIITTSHSSSSDLLSGGQHSQQTFPEHEDDIHTMKIRDDRRPSRIVTSASNEQNWYPRISPVVAQNQPSTEHRPNSRAGSIYMEPPRHITRAYSTTAEERPRPPSASRALSSSQIFPPHATDQWRPSPVYRSPSSLYTTPANGSSPWDFSHITPKPIQGAPAIAPNRVPATINLPPCLRESPVVGYHSWYTVDQVSSIKICQTCMETLGSSRFRDIFVPSHSSPSNEKIRCAMSQPWLRIAFIQASKQGRTPSAMISLLQSLLHLPEGDRPCAKEKRATRHWYRIRDPFDDTIVPGFEICTDCVRNVDLVFPRLRGIFTRTSALVQECICNFDTHSKRFLGYIEQLDAASSHFMSNTSLRKPDIQNLAKYARRVAKIKDCPRDWMLSSAEWRFMPSSTEWHFMPSLPGFTVCPECFEEVVRPVWDRVVANAIPKKACLLPSTSMTRDTRNVRAGAASCQLYSPRMRKVFNDAVMNDDFQALRDAAVQRRNVEVMCQARHSQLIELMKMQEASAHEKYRALIETNKDSWRSWQ